MHVLLISSNDLNEKNIFPSIFELAQAKALKAKGIKVGILSVGYYTTSNVSKALWKKIFSGSYNYYRFEGLNYAGLIGEFFRTFFNACVFHTDVRKLNVQGVKVYEALFNDFYFTLNKRGHKKWIGHGFKAYKEYIRDHGLPDIIHAHSRFLMGGLLAKRIKEKTGMPYVLTTHSSFYKRNLIKDFRKPLIKEVIEASDKFLAVSAALAKDVNERLGTDFDMEVMPNIIDETFEGATLSSKANNVFTFVSIGRLDENKNQQLLIRAFAAAVKKGLPAFLHLGGAGPELENLKKLAVKEGVEKKVTFLGHLSQKEVMEELLNSNVLCLTSRYETFGVIIIEALACGRPVIATDCGGPPELLNDKNGLVVKCDDVKELTEAMLTMFHNYEAYNSEQIRLDCLGRYSGKKISQRLLHIYEAVLNRPVLEADIKN